MSWSKIILFVTIPPHPVMISFPLPSSSYRQMMVLYPSNDERIELPANKDEIYTLTSTINQLLDRLEDAVLREKQFTSDASHELRTPLAAIKGTLEVLIRKPREVEQYESKISYCIIEVDRMSTIIDQLLMLARYDGGKISPHIIK